MNFPYNYREAFEEAVRRGLVRADEFPSVTCLVDRDSDTVRTSIRYYVDGRFIFETVRSELHDDVAVRFAEPPRTEHRPNSRLAAHEARWLNA